MDITDINCVSLFHGLAKPVPHPKPEQGNHLNTEKYIQHRKRTIEAIHQLNGTLAPPLDIRGAPVHVPIDCSRTGKLRPLYSSVEQASQTEVTGDVESKGIDLTTEAEIFTSVAERVKQKKYLCSLCGIEYQWRSSVYRHIKKNHKVNHETCEYCHVPFTSRDLLYAHLRYRQMQGFCRISRKINSAANKTVVKPPVNHEMRALYKSVDMWH